LAGKATPNFASGLKGEEYSKSVRDGKSIKDVNRQTDESGGFVSTQVIAGSQLLANHPFQNLK
jgi:hypothetical protein